MAPVFRSNSASTSSTTTLPLEAGISALTTAGESLFMCSTKEGHTCYHACRGHGKYPLWSDDTYMVDDIDEEEEEEEKTKAAPPERRRAWDDMDDSSDYSGEEEWLEEDADVDDSAFWQEIQDSVARHRARQNQRIHYAASDLRFLLTDGESTANTEVGPIVGVITTKPPPEYVWYMVDDDNWMRGSIPEKLSEEQDGAYFRYQYHTWDRIPNSDVRDSSSEDEYEDEVSIDEDPGPYDNVTDFEVDEEDPESDEEEEEVDVEEEDEEEEDVDVEVEESLQEVEVVTDNGDGRSWSELADLQEKQQTTS